jgi:DNA-binding MarR family transcriptional regulator
VDGLAQLSFLVQNALTRHAAGHGLSLAQTRLLGILRHREPTMNELARLLELDKSSITGLVDRAVRRGFVERVPSPSDGRAVLVRLTDKGRWCPKSRPVSRRMSRRCLSACRSRTVLRWPGSSAE